MALHTIVIDVPELFHPDDVEKAVTKQINDLCLIKGASTCVEVVEYHHEKMTDDDGDPANYFTRNPLEQER